jgi:hypothetical protein
MKTLLVLSLILFSFEAHPKETRLKNWGLSNIDAYSQKVWGLPKGRNKVIVAVIDTGIDSGQKDLSSNLWHDPSTGSYGWDFVEKKV